MTMDPTLQVFFDEAADLLTVFEEGVLGLETRPDDAEGLNAIFRAAHTLKGNSSMLGFERVARFTHTLEELLSRLRSGAVSAAPAVVTTLLAANDILKALIADVRDGEERPIEALDDVIAALQAHTRGQSPVPAAAPATRSTVAPTPGAAPRAAAPSGPRTLYEVRFTPRGAALQRGLHPEGILGALRELGEMVREDVSVIPPLESLDPEAVYPAFACWLMSRAPREAVEACFEFADEPGAVRIDGLVMGEPGAPRPAETAAAAVATTPLADRRQGGDRRQAERRASAADDSQSIRVSIDKVDRLINLVGELVITQSMVSQLVEGGVDAASLPRLREAVAQMDRHARDIQDRVMAVRMLPIKTVFGRFSRVVRDLAQSLGKRVQLETHGEETELDKTVIERIGDPLTHLVRNAVDHGLETPEERAAKGKPETGRVTLSAYQQGGSIYIEISEDGRGLDRERILAKAVDQGLVGAGDTLADEQVNALIFRPGFSTAKEVTSVSGRGVGMDVVRRNVEELGGSISIKSVPGEGTTFRIKLPLTLAILEGQLLRVGQSTFVLPLIAITESVRPTREALATVLGRGEALRMRGEAIPMLRLHRLLGVPGAEEEATRGLTVIVESDNRRAAILVDELLSQQQVVIKSLEASFQKVEGVAGATILGDGRVALILDVAGLVALAARAPVEQRAA